MSSRFGRNVLRTLWRLLEEAFQGVEHLGSLPAGSAGAGRLPTLRLPVVLVVAAAAPADAVRSARVFGYDLPQGKNFVLK